MSLSSEIRGHLRSLLRYSTALTGCPIAGKELVADAIEMLITDSDGFPVASCPLVSLYMHYNRVYSEAASLLPFQCPPLKIGPNVDIDISSWPPVKRQGFFLVTLADLSFAEAAETLFVSKEDLAELVTSAYAEIARLVAPVEREALGKLKSDISLDEHGSTVLGFADLAVPVHEVA